MRRRCWKGSRRWRGEAEGTEEDENPEALCPPPPLCSLFGRRRESSLERLVPWVGFQAPLEHVAGLGVLARLAVQVAEREVDLGLGDAGGLLVEALQEQRAQIATGRLGIVAPQGEPRQRAQDPRLRRIDLVRGRVALLGRGQIT